MQHWKISTAEKWEELSGLPYGQFFDMLGGTRKAKDLVTLLACEAYNNNKAVDIQAEILQLNELTMGEVWQRIGVLYKTEAVDEEKKST